MLFRFFAKLRKVPNLLGERRPSCAGHVWSAGRSPAHVVQEGGVGLLVLVAAAETSLRKEVSLPRMGRAGCQGQRLSKQAPADQGQWLGHRLP